MPTHGLCMWPGFLTTGLSQGSQTSYSVAWGSKGKYSSEQGILFMIQPLCTVFVKAVMSSSSLMGRGQPPFCALPHTLLMEGVT